MTTKKRICTVIIVLVIVCAVCVGGFFVWKKTGKGGSKSSQKVYVQKVSSLNTASDFKLSNRSFLGVVEAQESVDVKYDSSKTVAEILVKNGDSVKKGDKLLTYDVEAINLQLEQAKLEVERLQNEIASNKSQIAELEKEKKNADQDAAVSYTTQILSLQSDNAKNEYDIKAKNVEIKSDVLVTALGITVTVVVRAKVIRWNRHISLIGGSRHALLDRFVRVCDIIALFKA